MLIKYFNLLKKKKKHLLLFYLILRRYKHRFKLIGFHDKLEEEN